MDILNVPIAIMAQYIFGILMFLTSLFLILLVLVQRGRGGGLAGAFGGMGGQSAFGTKAGDLFTRLTMGVAGFWIVLCVLAITMLNHQGSPLGAGGTPGLGLGTPLDGSSSGTLPGALLPDSGLLPETGSVPEMGSISADATESSDKSSDKGSLETGSSDAAGALSSEESAGDTDTDPTSSEDRP
jgi:preprotein translocase subunit SecG